MFYLFIFIFLFIFILGSANVIGDFTGSCSLLQSNSRALSILNICFGLKKLFFLVSMAKKLIPCKRNDFAPLTFQLKKWRGRQVLKKSKHMHAVLTKMSLCLSRGPSKFWCKTSHETPNYSVYVYTLDCMYVCMYTLYTLYTVCMYVCIHYILYVCTYMPVERFLVRTPHSAAMEEFIAEAAHWFYGQ